MKEGDTLQVVGGEYMNKKGTFLSFSKTKKSVRILFSDIGERTIRISSVVLADADDDKKKKTPRRRAQAISELKNELASVTVRLGKIVLALEELEELDDVDY